MGGGQELQETEEERAKGKGNTTIIDRTCVCFFSDREGERASEKRPPQQQQSPKRRKKEDPPPPKKGSVKSPTHKSFFFSILRKTIHPFSIPQGGDDRSPPPLGSFLKQ